MRPVGGCAASDGDAAPDADWAAMATTAGSMRITVYPATAPAPKPGAKTRIGLVITPSRTASWMASGMLAEDALPTFSMLK